MIRAGRPYRLSELGIDDDELCWGVMVGSCIDERVAWGIWVDAGAHAHNEKGSDWEGWICVMRPEDVLTPTGKPSKMLLHEYAHLLVPNEGHSRKWKREVTKLGAGSEIARCKLSPL